MQRFAPTCSVALLLAFVCPPSRAQQTSSTSEPVRITAQPGTPAGTAGASRSRRPRQSAPAQMGGSPLTAGQTLSSATGASDQPIASEDRPLLPVATLGNSLGIASGTPIQVRLAATVDSGHAKNGDTLNGTLAAPLGSMPMGTPVALTVISSVAAGRIESYGELSVQVVTVGGHPLLSNVISTQGQEGHKDVADSAPARGTEALLQADQAITLPAA